MVYLTDDTGNYYSPGANFVMTRTLNTATNGGIIFIHDGVQQNVDVLPKMIRALKKQGYRFVTVDEMMAGARTNSKKAANP